MVQITLSLQVGHAMLIGQALRTVTLAIGPTSLASSSAIFWLSNALASRSSFSLASLRGGEGRGCSAPPEVPSAAKQVQGLTVVIRAKAGFYHNQ